MREAMEAVDEVKVKLNIHEYMNIYSFLLFIAIKLSEIIDYYYLSTFIQYFGFYFEYFSRHFFYLVYSIYSWPTLLMT